MDKKKKSKTQEQGNSLTFGRCSLLALGINGVHGSLEDTMKIFMEIEVWTP